MPDHKFDTRWFKGISPSEAEDLKKSLLSSKKVLDKLSEICYNISISKENIREGDYDNPSWAYKQAHLNGYRDALNTIIRLTSLE